MIPNGLKGRYVYHFTAIQNLKSIVSDGLLSTNLKVKAELEHRNIANNEIQQRRKKMPVTCGPRGVVHDYVPFYFSKRTPMLLNIVKSKNIDQTDIIYLAIPIEKVLEKNVVFSDASANTISPPNFFDEADDLRKLNFEVIDSWRWSYEGREKNQKMAELLVHEKIEIRDVSHIVVWNTKYKKVVENILSNNKFVEIKVNTDFYNDFRYHYFYDFKKSGRVNIITGPRRLRLLVLKNIDSICRIKNNSEELPCLKSMLEKISINFCCIKELADIDGLETDNPIHKEDVGKHSRTVKKLVKKDKNFNSYTESEKNILLFSALLHDIGKGPKSRWNDGIQKVDDDHPRKSLPMLKRILSEELSGLTRDDIRRIHILVVFDDLVGDIVARGRDKEQLFKIIENKTDVDLLISLGRSDMGAINPDWVDNNYDKIEDLRKEAYEKLESNE